MGIEFENAREALRLVRKETPKHISLVVGLYALSCKEPELGKVARASYFFMRHMDDVLDGDRTIGTDPLSYGLEVRKQIETGEYTGNPAISVLAQYSIDTLRFRSREGDDPQKDFLESIDSMVFDYERAKDRRILSSAEINAYYWQTFSPVINILLVGLRSNLRARHIPALAMCQGRLYTIRDLKTDWHRGVINIPQEVLNAAGIDANSALAEVLSNQQISEWFGKEASECSTELIALQKQMQNEENGLAFAVCNRLIKWMLKFSDKLIPDT